MTEEQKSVEDIMEAPVSEEERQAILEKFVTSEVRKNRILDIISTEFAKVEALTLRTAYLYVGPKFFGYMRECPADTFVMTTKASDMKKGIMGEIWGATVICERRNDMYFVEARPEEEPQEGEE